MFIFRLIPGVLWLDVLDKATDQCQTLLGWRLPCSLLILFAWMSFLGELRVQVVKGIQYIKVVYYKPNQVTIKKFYGQWQARLAMCAVVCGLSYYLTFEFEDDFPYLAELKEIVENEQHSKKIDDVEEKEVFLMAHVFVQRLLQQAQAIVWILGTLLRLNRKRFVKLSGMVFMMKPLGSFLVAFCGNFALWLCLGHTLLRAADLSPEGRSKFGSLGCLAALLASTIWFKKFGTSEIIVAIAAGVGAEIAWMNAFKKVQDNKARAAEKEKLGIKDRAWTFLANLMADLVQPDDDAENTATNSKKKDDDIATKEEADEKAFEEVPYTHPSIYSWVAIFVYWAAVGIRLDGYDVTTL